MRRFMSFSLVVLFLAAPSWARDDFHPEEVQRFLSYFQLWNGCAPMLLTVEPLPEDADKIGLTKDEIETAVRSRLRGARIYSDRRGEDLPILHVQVSVFKNTFAAIIQYNKIVEDHASKLTNYATTWHTTGSIGTHGGSSDLVMHAINGEIDEFIDEYLKVNSDACD